jgi:hypothetical protein
MKAKILYALLAAPVLWCGCSSTKFTEYHGTDVFTGKGGLERSVGEVDFWENGDPDRPYRILGFVEEKPGQRIPLGRLSKVLSDPDSDADGDESAVARIAHKKGGDAVIIVGGNQDPLLQGESRHGHGSRKVRKYLLIKYAD